MSELSSAAPLVAISAAAVSFVIGYIGVAINAVRRLRQGKLRSVSASLPGLRFIWDKDDQQYEIRTPFGSISIGGPSTPSSPDGYIPQIENLAQAARDAAHELDAALREMAEAASERRSGDR